MNVLFISNGVFEYDGRLRELIKVAKGLGETQYITTTISKDTKQEGNHHIVNNSNGIFGYLKFIIYSVHKGLKLKSIDILFVDNRKSLIPAFIIKTIKKPKYIILDSRELYLIGEVNHVTGKIGCMLEKWFINKSNIIICANKYRAEIMRDYYRLDSKPLVYENIRYLEYSGKITEKKLKEKYDQYFTKDTIRIVSTSGCSISRTNDKLVEAMINLGEKFELFLIGGGNYKDINKIRNIINENKLNNVHIIDKLQIDELKYFLKNCHIGIVNYHKKDMNNKYCASGKVYEYLFEGLPVVTTENIPLVDICNTYKIGIADDSYIDAIKEVSTRYDYYVENVKKYTDKINSDKNNIELIKRIKNKI